MSVSNIFLSLTIASKATPFLFDFLFRRIHDGGLVAPGVLNPFDIIGIQAEIGRFRRLPGQSPPLLNEECLLFRKGGHGHPFGIELHGRIGERTKGHLFHGLAMLQNRLQFENEHCSPLKQALQFLTGLPETHLLFHPLS